MLCRIINNYLLGDNIIITIIIFLLSNLNLLDKSAVRETAADAPLRGTPVLVQKYIDYLKDRYINKSPLLKEKVLKIRPKEFIHLNLVSNEVQEKEEEQVKLCLMLQLYGDVAAIKKKRRPMEMEDIGRREDQSVAQHILVEGSPGIGKTMFSWELCRQWAEGKMLQDRDIVLMLQLRSKRVREAKSLSDLFHHDNDSIKQEVLEHITSVDGRGVFVVLEGYDELTEDQRTEGSILNSLLTGDCLPKASIMVTSRPLASGSLCPEFIESVVQHIEIVGFTDEDIKLYVQKACQKLPEVLPHLMLYIASNPFVSSIMYIPLQCAALTALYIEKWRENKGKAYAPTTLTQLYTDLLLSSLIRYISDHPVYSKCKTKIRQLSELPSEVQEQVWKLSQLAAEGLENRQFIFDSIPFDHMGLMQSAEEELVIGSSVSYCFLHLTLQEYLAALHWSRMSSEDMVRLVSETSLFPLDTLVRDGITAGHHWPALYFLSGLTKLTSVPLRDLLSISLKAGDNDIDDGDINNLFVMNLFVDFSMSNLTAGKNCNPYFFQVLFEAQSADLNSKLFHEVSVTTTVNNPLESFVTAWCVANCDMSTSKWKCTFANVLILRIFVALHCGSSCCSSIVGILLHCTQEHLIGLSALQELSRTLPSVFPCLEFFGFFVTPFGIAEMMPMLYCLPKLVALKWLHINTIPNTKLPVLLCINAPPLYCPSLRNVLLDGELSEVFIQPLVLPNIDNLTVLILNECRPKSGPDFRRFCTCLSQSTSLECLSLENVTLNSQELKELVSALEQIKSLRVVVYNNMAPVTTEECLRHLKQVAIRFHQRTQTPISEKELDERMQEARSMCKPLRSLIADHEFVQNPVTEGIIPFMSLTEDSGDERNDRKRGLQIFELSEVKKRAMQSDEQDEEN